MTPLLSTCTLGNDCYDPISLPLSPQPKPPKGRAPLHKSIQLFVFTNIK